VLRANLDYLNSLGSEVWNCPNTSALVPIGLGALDTSAPRHFGVTGTSPSFCRLSPDFHSLSLYFVVFRRFSPTFASFG